MKKVIAFAGSNSKQSINKQLVTYAASKVAVEVEVLDINDFSLPLYGIDYEIEHGIPDNAHKFLEAIKNSAGLLVSLAEHNGAYSTAFKNLFDWMSRIEGKTFYGKHMLLMATSPGGRGGQSVLAMAQDRFPRHDAKVEATFSLPFFSKNFVDGKIVDNALEQELQAKVEAFNKAI